MDSNPYAPPPETPDQGRPVSLPRLLLVASLAAALMLGFFDASRWLIVVAGAVAAFAAEETNR